MGGPRVAVGATVEDVGFAPEITAGGVHEVLRETLRVMPGLCDATLREVRVGLRPVSVDDAPILGALPGTGNVFVATGHGANGLLLGPVSGALVADLVLGRDPVLDLAPFSPALHLTVAGAGSRRKRRISRAFPRKVRTLTTGAKRPHQPVRSGG